jgi:hypothetical protein
MKSQPKLIITITIATLLGALIFVYIFTQSKDYLAGPLITVDYPIPGSTVYGPSVEIRGTAKRITSISLNEGAILTDQNGNFKEKLILPAGYNIMKFEAKDRFGKRTERLLEFMVTSTSEEINL